MIENNGWVAANSLSNLGKLNILGICEPVLHQTNASLSPSTMYKIHDAMIQDGLLFDSDRQWRVRKILIRFAID